jgi:threonine dehydrogenase-like Zn-dependent dehydrogenase
MNRSITLKTGQCHVQRYTRPLLRRIENGEIAPSFVISHRLSLEEAHQAYETFKHNQDDCVKVVLSA